MNPHLIASSQHVVVHYPHRRMYEAKEDRYRMKLLLKHLLWSHSGCYIMDTYTDTGLVDLNLIFKKSFHKAETVSLSKLNSFPIWTAWSMMSNAVSSVLKGQAR